MKLSASFLSAPHRIKELDKTNIDFIHCDIMDGVFVKNITNFFSPLEDIYKDLNHKLDIHLMVSNIQPYISIYSSLNPEFLTFHLEIGNTLELINIIKSHNIKVGISIKPDTAVEELEPYLDKADLILVMSVEPGAGGQKFLENAIPKLKYLKDYRSKNNLNYLIEIDGGINEETISKCTDADMVVVGSFLLKQEDIQGQIKKIIK